MMPTSWRTLNERKRKITKADFDTFSVGLKLPEKAVSNIYTKFTGASKKVEEMIQSSFLPQRWKQRYIRNVKY